jgi:DNA-binding MarR family transcriptional regulator
MPTDTNITELAKDLSRAMAEMRNYLRLFLQSKIKEHELDITFELFEVVIFLYKKDGVNQQEIADVMIKDKSSMTYLIDNLVKRDMVTRIEDENDRRNKLIFLTEKGKSLRSKLDPWIEEIYEKATAGIKAAEITKAIKLVQSMNENLKAV